MVLGNFKHSRLLTRKDVVEALRSVIDDLSNEEEHSSYLPPISRACDLLSVGMKDEKIHSALAASIERLERAGYSPMREDEGTCQPENHAYWCALEAIRFIDEGRREKAMRWLGFVQGVTFASGIATVEELKNDSRPDEYKVTNDP